MDSTLAQTTHRCVLNAHPRERVTLSMSSAAPSLLHPDPSAMIFFSVHQRDSAGTCAAGDQLEGLPPALRPVAEGLALGLSDKEIAERLQLTLATARTYVARTLRRLGASSRRELMLRR